MIDKQAGDHFVGDIAKKEVLEAFEAKYGQSRDFIDDAKNLLADNSVENRTGRELS